MSGLGSGFHINYVKLARGLKNCQRGASQGRISFNLKVMSDNVDTDTPLSWCAHRILLAGSLTLTWRQAGRFPSIIL
jgi:hypothetical protein